MVDGAVITMWILIIIIVSQLGAKPTVSRVNSFHSLKECEDTRLFVTEEMNKSYPIEEQNYTLECVPARKPQ